DFKRAAKTDLLGKDVEPIAVDEGSLELALAPWEIATLRLTP
ncbi:MAG: glycosyl hydrolase-related protein, partial [Actinomycetota bacterium]